MIDEEVSRRSFMKLLGMAGVAAAVPLTPLVIEDAAAELMREAGEPVSGDVEALIDGRWIPIGNLRDVDVDMHMDVEYNFGISEKENMYQ